MKKQNEYEIESNGKLQYVVVRCPSGHRNRGLKGGTQNIRQTLLCAARGCITPEWEQLAPSINGLEAI